MLLLRFQVGWLGTPLPWALEMKAHQQIFIFLTAIHFPNAESHVLKKKHLLCWVIFRKRDLGELKKARHTLAKDISNIHTCVCVWYVCAYVYTHIHTY